MQRARRGKCFCCGDLFTADARNRGRQKYCSKAACRASSKAARQHRWLTKPENQDYFRGAVHTQRQRAWRAAHPGYWRSDKRLRATTSQDALRVQVTEVAKESTPLPLQDACRLHDPLLIGLIAHLSDCTSQDAIASTSRRLLQLGQAILTGGTNDAHQTAAAP